jgi:hypothetical protein
MESQAVLDLTRLLVWPVALIVLAIVFRKPLGRLLVTITSLRFRDLEIDFGRELEKLGASLPPQDPQGAGSDRVQAEWLEDPIIRLATQAVTSQPLAGVLLAWSALESRRGTAGDQGTSGALPAKLTLPKDVEHVVRGLAELSSAAAGGQLKGGTLSEAQARDYVHLVDRTLRWLDSAP